MLDKIWDFLGCNNCSDNVKKTLPTLQPGDIIDVIAPAGASNVSIDQIVDFISKLGFKARVNADMVQPGVDLFSANSDEYRLNALQDALTNKESKAVWCLRGGYGSAKLIEGLMEMPKPETNKLFIGFSDITALHTFLNQEWGWPTIHGTMVAKCIASGMEYRALQELCTLITNAHELHYNLEPMNDAAKAVGSINSTICGGNLSMLQTSLATDWQIDPKHKILFLEDVNEKAYRVDRMLEHLKQAGILDELDAVLLGDFSTTPEDMPVMNMTLDKFAKSMDVPVMRCHGFGHEDTNHPLPFNTDVVLLTGEQAELVCIF
jgi:muramoyltetrapeptide carboxypeptidase